MYLLILLVYLGVVLSSVQQHQAATLEVVLSGNTSSNVSQPCTSPHPHMLSSRLSSFRDQGPLSLVFFFLLRANLTWKMSEDADKLFAFGGAITPGGPSRWHVLDFDQRRTVVVIMNEEVTEDEIAEGKAS